MSQEKIQAGEIFAVIRVGELRPFKQLVELHEANLELKYIAGYIIRHLAKSLMDIDRQGYVTESFLSDHHCLQKDQHSAQKHVNAC